MAIYCFLLCKVDAVTPVTVFLRCGRWTGLEEGCQNARQPLISLLTAKFGASAAGVLDRVEAGSQEQLARWTLAVLTVNTPEEVFRLQ